MDCRIESFLLEGTIKMQLHIAGALEFFENQFVHSTAGFSQSGRKHSQTAAFFHIARRAEKFLWFGKRLRFYATGHNSSSARLHVVVPARKPRDTVEQKHNILSHFHEAFGTRYHHLCYLHVSLHAFVKIGMVDRKSVV